MYVIRRLQPDKDTAEWLRLRLALFSDTSADENKGEMAQILSTDNFAVYVCPGPDGRLMGFVEVGERDYAEGCDTSPVAYIEAWYVEADNRRQGMGRQLFAAAETWATSRGHTEIASDTLLDNMISQQAHLALGYEEMERQINYRKQL